MKLPSRSQLETAYQEAARIHKTHLDQHGVKLPATSTRKWVWLAMLMHFQGEPVHKDAISDAVQREFPGSGRDQQVRHLKRDGWNIEPAGNGEHILENPYTPSQEFVTQRARRQGRISAEDFESLIKTFGNRCATCGGVQDEPDPRYGGDVIKLQRGHQNPHRPGDRSNTIPQCQFCNRAYKDDYEFDDKGRVRAVANVGPVKRARQPVQRKIYDFLKEKMDDPSDF